MAASWPGGKGMRGAVAICRVVMCVWVVLVVARVVLVVIFGGVVSS